MESKTAKFDIFDDSLLPPSFEESTKGQSTTATSCYHVHINHFPGGTHAVEQTACGADGPLPEKSQLNVEPLKSEQLAVINNEDVPPPYEEKQGLWSTVGSKLRAGFSRIYDIEMRLHRCRRRMFVPACFIIGSYLCVQGLTVLLVDYEFSCNLITVRDLALEAVNIVHDIENIPAEYEGKLIYVKGPILVEKPLEYDECGVSVGTVKLRRTFDKCPIYMKTSYAENYFYSKKWPEIRLDKDQICSKPNHGFKLPLLPEDDVKIAEVVKIGPLKLGHRLKRRIDEFYIVSDKVMELDDITGVRVMYAAAGRNGSTYSFVGKLKNGTIDVFEIRDSYHMSLHAENEVSATDMISDRINYRLKGLDGEKYYAYLMFVMGILTPLLAMVYTISVKKAMMRKNRDRMSVSIPMECRCPN